MAEARGKFEWEQTSAIMALVVNMLRDPKKSKPVNPEDFNPYHKKIIPRLKAPISILKDVFVKK